MGRSIGFRAYRVKGLWGLAVHSVQGCKMVLKAFGFRVCVRYGCLRFRVQILV